MLPIGGLKEKILAAHRALIKTVLIPKENAKDLKEIPAKILEEINIELVTHMDDVLRLALAPGEVGSCSRNRKHPLRLSCRRNRRETRFGRISAGSQRS